MAFFTLNNTLADERANSYASLDDLTSYWDSHWDQTTAAAVQALNEDQQTALLITACRTLETLRFTEPVDPLADYHLVVDTRQQQVRSVKTNYGRPQKYDYSQSLQFPRTLDVYLDGTVYIPPTILQAQCEQAAYELTFDPSILENVLQGITKDYVSVGNVTVSQTFAAGSGKGTRLSSIAYSLCKPFLINQVIRLQRA